MVGQKWLGLETTAIWQVYALAGCDGSQMHLCLGQLQVDAVVEAQILLGLRSYDVAKLWHSAVATADDCGTISQTSSAWIVPPAATRLDAPGHGQSTILSCTPTQGDFGTAEEVIDVQCQAIEAPPAVLAQEVCAAPLAQAQQEAW